MSDSGVELYRGIGDHRRAIWEPGTRTPPEQRKIINWPLLPVSLNVPVSPEDFERDKTYPPMRMRQRQNRLKIYTDLYRGEFGHFIEDTGALGVNVNYFGRICEILSSLLVSSDPPGHLVDPLMVAIVDLLRFGRTYMFRVEDEFHAADPTHAFQTADGETLYIVTPYTSLNSDIGAFDRGIVYALQRQGEGEVWDAELKDGRWGALGLQETVDGAWGFADRPPVMDGWGKSAFDHLIPIVVQLAIRLTGIERVLAAHEAPTLVLPMSNADAANIVGITGDPTSLDQVNKTNINRAVRSFRDNDIVWAPDGVGDPAYLTWDGQLAPSFAMIDTLKSELRMLTGVPAALEQEGGDIPSGSALREMFIILYWTATQLHSRVKEVAEEVLGESIEWPNPFEYEVQNDEATGGARNAAGGFFNTGAEGLSGTSL